LPGRRVGGSGKKVPETRNSPGDLVFFISLSSRSERSGVEGPCVLGLSSRSERSGVEGPCVLGLSSRPSEAEARTRCLLSFAISLFSVANGEAEPNTHKPQRWNQQHDHPSTDRALSIL